MGGRHEHESEQGWQTRGGATLAQLFERRMQRREAIALGIWTSAWLAGCGAGARAGQGSTPGRHGSAARGAGAEVPRSRAGRGAASARFPFDFQEIPSGADDRLHVPVGYRADVILADGDPIAKGAKPWDPRRRTAADAALQFGSNADFTAFLPLPPGPDGAARGLLSVNHEHPSTRFLFDDLDDLAGLPWVERQAAIGPRMNAARVALEQAVLGHSVVEVRREAGRWRAQVDSPLNRRIDARTTPITVAGPAAGHRRMQTAADPTGRTVIGTFHNCSGGVTPWGTVLIGEENFDNHFRGDIKGLPNEASLRRAYFENRKSWPWWGEHDPRFDVRQHPNEPNRFGWIVELDPYDPEEPVRKRTALGRFSHEAAGNALTPDGRVVVYMGDDKHGEYLYRFVSTGRVDRRDRRRNRELLDEGELSVACFSDDGTLRWAPLRHGQGPLVAANGFNDQADVVIDARRAADLLGATPLDRPEDVEPQPGTGVVIVALTNNAVRERADAANPRRHNRFGHLLALLPPGAPGKDVDHAAPVFRWELALLAGNPADANVGAEAHPSTTEHGWLASPDNVAYDPAGRLWVATDQGSHWTDTGRCDGLYAVATDGDAAFWSRLFLRAPLGAEVAGPSFTPDGRTLFVSIQHPGVDVQGSTFGKPATRFPDYDPELPPRAAVVAIEREDGGPIGGPGR
ncbi:MAG: hypothetical protein RIT45_3628 [Pseudomonadota bacterium]|jgi:secreted PhoX family phosphatase